MQNKHSWLAFVAVVVMVNAQAADDTLSSINIGELGKVQSQTILYKAMAERRDAQRKAEGQSLDDFLPNGTIPAGQPLAVQGEPLSEDSRLPVVAGITGSNQRLRATVLHRGTTFDTRVGSDLPGGFKVHQITLEGVVLSRGGKLYPLGFSNRQSSLEPSNSLRPASQPFNLPGQLPGQ